MISSITLELPTSAGSVAVARHALDDLLDTAGVADRICWDLALALTEGCSNAVRHAAAGPSYRVDVQLADGRCLMEICDQGPGFDPAGVRVPDLDDDGCRGLLIMATVVDHLKFGALQPRGMKVTMLKTWHRPSTPHTEDSAGWPPRFA
jgi:serine/threonine-protein kinase RsbW